MPTIRRYWTASRCSTGCTEQTLRIRCTITEKEFIPPARQHSHHRVCVAVSVCGTFEGCVDRCVRSSRRMRGNGKAVDRSRSATDVARGTHLLVVPGRAQSSRLVSRGKSKSRRQKQKRSVDSLSDSEQFAAIALRDRSRVSRRGVEPQPSWANSVSRAVQCSARTCSRCSRASHATCWKTSLRVFLKRRDRAHCQETPSARGEIRHWVISKIPMWADNSGQVTHVITVGEEVTDRVEANRAIARAEN